MSENVNLTNDGLSITAVHSNPSYEANITLDNNLKLIIEISNTGCNPAYDYFDYDVGYRVSGYNKNTGDYKEIEGEPKRLTFNIGTENKVSVNFEPDISSLSFPIKLELLCQGCDHNNNGTYLVPWDNGKGIYIINDARHTHISTPAAPTIVKTTGKTITVRGDNKVKEGKNGEAYDSDHKFGGYEQGSEHIFYAEKSCPECPDKLIFTSSNGTTAKTWDISIVCTYKSSNTLKFKATHTAGTIGYANSNTITYVLYFSEDRNTAFKRTTGNNGSEIEFTGLPTDREYYCKALTTGMDDNICGITVAIKKFEVEPFACVSVDVSAKTLRICGIWEPNDSKNIKCEFSCNGWTVTRTESEKYATFTGLEPGATYTIKFSIYDDGGNKVSSSATVTTKKAMFNNIQNTSKIIKYSSYSNKSEDKMEQKIDGRDYTPIYQGTYISYDNLIHNTTYKIYTRIKDCYAFDAEGNETEINDSEISTDITTYELTLEGSIYEQHQHSIVTLWQAKVNGSNCDRDLLDNSPFNFTSTKTVAKKDINYQQSEIIENNNGDTIGNYQVDKKIYSTNLTWYYCKYIITAEISDGYNKVSASVTAHTTFPYTWIYNNGSWHKAIPYIYTNNKFVPAPCFVYNNDKYIEPNGE